MMLNCSFAFGAVVLLTTRGSEKLRQCTTFQPVYIYLT